MEIYEGSRFTVHNSPCIPLDRDHLALFQDLGEIQQEIFNERNLDNKNIILVNRLLRFHTHRENLYLYF